MRLNLWFSVFVFALSVAAIAAGQPQRPVVKIALVGDSTVNDAGGWGPGFRAAFSVDVDCLNFARNGRSSKSFRNEGLWAPALEAKPDYILIQFGHNDGPGKGPDRETDPATTYCENIVRYVEEARAAGAVPILVTSIVRRNLDSNGNFRPDTLAPYAEAVRKIAEELDTPLIDLYALTKSMCEQMGPAGCDSLGRTGPDGKLDRTHLGPLGQQKIGALAAAELARVAPALKPYWRPSANPQ